MKKWTPAAIGIGLLVTFGVATAEGLMTFPTPQRGIPWGSAILSGLGGSALALYLRIRRRRRRGRELPAGEYMLAVKGAPGVRYTVGFDDETEVIWRSVEATDGDPWYTSVHRSSGEPAGLDVIVYDEDGMPVREWFYLASWIRNDCALDAIMARAGRNPSALNFRVLLDIGESAVRLAVFPGAEPPPRNDEWTSHPEFRKSGTTVWLGKRDEFGRWVEKRQWK
ncbi:hypothetical protein C8J98_103399 [Luteibacter sp. OK325]|uniref:hypothetical protein n=1 Tax=Luteibacter sp. OK325 TaxID=2135670 RepID=UPI000D3397A3|nr:hypothetical protein [Luteibacter sp. OK325]PTR33636.1 hypothetical protein C8J98_103399 [Luteibacter sp. OK325]